MILAGNAEGVPLEADVCVIGGGPAAISVALQLLKTSARVLLLVGGGATYESAADQDLNRGVLERPGSHESLEENRRRVFGGASSVWGGRCIPLDPIDFEQRASIPESGWPIGYEALEPFYREALTLCEAGAYRFDSREVFPETSAEIIPGMDSTELESWHLERWSPPIDFARRFEQQLSASEQVRVYLDTHVLRLASTARREEIGMAEAICRGTRFEVRAKVFVLAVGGIENARLLLASQSEYHPAGVGNDRDLVGRFYMAHPHGTYASLAPRRRDAIIYDYERDRDGVYCRRRWALPAATQRRLGIGNIIFFLDRTDPAQGHRDAIFSAVFLAKAGLGLARRGGTGGRWRRLRGMLPEVKQHLRTVVSDGPGLLVRLVKLGKARLEKGRRLPSLLPTVSSKYLGLYFQAEQMPNRESRITLSPMEKDDHGVPRAVVEIAFTEADVRTVVQAHRVFMERYRAAGAGECIYDEAELEEYVRAVMQRFNSAAHHLGTTRMADTPEHGVVDADCRVHGIENLYVAGSSVFPTGGHANPTLTLVALALRLGAHLADSLPS